VGNFIHQDWLDALGMEKPTTVDELTAYLRAAKEAGLGGDSTVPFAFSIFESDPLFNVRRITDAFVDFSQVTEEDRYANARTPEMLPGAREGFRWLNTLYHEGLLPDTFALTDNDQANDTMLIMGYNGFFSRQPVIACGPIHGKHDEGSPPTDASAGSCLIGVFHAVQMGTTEQQVV